MSTESEFESVAVLFRQWEMLADRYQVALTSVRSKINEGTPGMYRPGYLPSPATAKFAITLTEEALKELTRALEVLREADRIRARLEPMRAAK